MRTLFIDPGTTSSGWVLWDTDQGLDGCMAIGIDQNECLLGHVQHDDDIDHVVIEDIQSYGMPVGAEVFRAVVWIGRFIQARPRSWELLARREVKRRLCGTVTAKDANVRQAVIDLMGPAPTKARPNPHWPAKPRRDIWAAAGMALAWMQIEEERCS